MTNQSCGESASHTEENILESHEGILGSLVNDVDLVLVGDGSGTQLGKAAGWFVYCYDVAAREGYSVAGAVSTGTNNYAELYPYIHALWDYQGRKKPRTGCSVRVRIVSDSEVTVRTGKGEYHASANLPFWAAIRSLEQSGFELDWVHIPRGTLIFNRFADAFAGEFRRQMILSFQSINGQHGLTGSTNVDDSDSTRAIQRYVRNCLAGVSDCRAGNSGNPAAFR